MLLQSLLSLVFACSGRRRIKHYDPISQIAQLFAVCTQSMFQVIDQSPGGQECEVRVGKGVSQQSESKQDRSPTIRFESSSLKREVDDDMRVDVGSLQVFKGGVSGVAAQRDSAMLIFVSTLHFGIKRITHRVERLEALE